MWVVVCRDCVWSSGEAYLRSVADYMATVHVEDHAGHKVVVRQAGKPREVTAAAGSAGRSQAS